MGEWFTREVLYELVWSEPVSKIAPRYGTSTANVTAACRRALIPMPGRGYWAKRRSEKTAQRDPLPPRGPGMSRRAFIGSLRQRWTGQRATGHVEEPVAPQFPDDIADIEAAARARIGRPRLPSLSAQTHPVIARLMAEDAKRRANPRSWSKPRFDGPEAQRRLRVANGLFLARERVGVEPGVHDHGEPRFGATVGHTWVPLSIDVSSHRIRSGPGGRRSTLEVRIEAEGFPAGARVWNEFDQKLDQQLGEIAAAVVAAGELLYRAGEREYYELVMDYRRRQAEEARRREIEAARREEERRRAEEQARIDRLLAEAEQFRQAADIRSYVSAARVGNARSVTPIPGDAFETWAYWAIAEADRLDPVISGRFMPGQLPATRPGDSGRGAGQLVDSSVGRVGAAPHHVAAGVPSGVGSV